MTTQEISDALVEVLDLPDTGPSAELLELEKRILTNDRKESEARLAMGRDLEAIRFGGLYRERQFNTFDDYVNAYLGKERGLSVGHARAYQLTDYARTVGLLSTVVDISLSERASRELLPLLPAPPRSLVGTTGEEDGRGRPTFRPETPDLLVQAFETAVAMATDRGLKTVTAKDVRKAAQPLLAERRVQAKHTLNVSDEGADEIQNAAPVVMIGKVQVKRGQVFRLAGHRVMCGNSTDEADVAKLMRGKKAAMAFTDPPYNVKYIGGAHAVIQNSVREAIENDDMFYTGDGFEEVLAGPWVDFVRGFARMLLQNVDGAIYICMSSSQTPILNLAMQKEGGHWSDTLLWLKTGADEESEVGENATIGWSDHQRAYEPIWYGWREGAKHHWIGHRFQTNVYRAQRKSKHEYHPTEKPFGLARRAITNTSRELDIVFDPFLGGGTTLLVADLVGRSCYGMELDPQYVQTAIRRWEEQSGLKAELVR